MNISDIVTRIKLKLGLNAVATPFKDLNGTITEIIQTITLPVFSLYVPNMMTVTVETSTLPIEEQRQNMVAYTLPELKRTILEVKDVRYSETSMTGLGFYTGQFPLFQNGMFGSYMLSNATAQIMQQMIPKMTFKFIPPRTLQIYNAYYNSEMVLDINFVHDKSLASIPETARESFLKLALLDVKENLYPTLKHFTNTETAYGHIDLKLDNWDGAESERTELLNQWDDTYHLDQQPVYFI